MPAECGLQRELPNIAGVQRVAYVVVRRTVRPTQIVWILWRICKGQPVPVCKGKQPTVRDLVQTVAVCVVSLKKTLTPTAEAVLERNH